jgi:poly(3-hydroxybutyrate) depolymerase
MSKPGAYTADALMLYVHQCGSSFGSREHRMGLTALADMPPLKLLAQEGLLQPIL